MEADESGVLRFRVTLHPSLGAIYQDLKAIPERLRAGRLVQLLTLGHLYEAMSHQAGFGSSMDAGRHSVRPHSLPAQTGSGRQARKAAPAAGGRHDAEVIAASRATSVGLAKDRIGSPLALMPPD
ncbi:MAG: hypothetical protein KF871_12755 [Hydrogenophaga sp.]|nr:hypothetical protein [Hydrogenophaga sp.]